jgi:hypothetical protein
MHRGDPRQGLIVGVERRGNSREGGHEPVGRDLRSISAAEQTFDLAPLAHHKASVAPLDQRRAAEHQAVFGAGEAEIVVAVFTETPEPMNHFRPIIGDYMRSDRPLVNRKETALDIVSVMVT